jgi:hypothetical protein
MFVKSLGDSMLLTEPIGTPEELHAYKLIVLIAGDAVAAFDAVCPAVCVVRLPSHHSTPQLLLPDKSEIFPEVAADVSTIGFIKAGGAAEPVARGRSSLGFIGMVSPFVTPQA